MKVDKLVDEIIKQYRQDRKILVNENWYLDNTVKIVLFRHDVYDDTELESKLIDIVSNKVKSPKLWSEEEQKRVEKSCGHK